MVQGGVVLGHVVSSKGIEVVKAKVEVIEKLPPLTSLNGVKSFLGCVSFICGSLNIFRQLENLSPNCLSRMCLLNLMKNDLVLFIG